MATVENRMGGVICGLEDDPCLGSGFPIIYFGVIESIVDLIDSRLPLVPISVLFRIMLVRRCSARTGSSGRRFEFTRSLPFGTTTQPEYEPVIRDIFFAEVCGKEKCWKNSLRGVSRYPKVDSQLTKWDQAELDTRLAVSTVPPRTTSFMPSTSEELP